MQPADLERELFDGRLLTAGPTAACITLPPSVIRRERHVSVPSAFPNALKKAERSSVSFTLLDFGLSLWANSCEQCCLEHTRACDFLRC
jgi:hypothetical protein